MKAAFGSSQAHLLVTLTTSLALAGLSGLARAEALPACQDAVTPTVAVKDSGILESLAFDQRGRLLYTNTSSKSLKVVTQPGAAPTVVAANISEPGGIALGAQNDVYVGQGNGFGGFFPAAGKAKLLNVDLDSGNVTTYASGLAMPNGVVRASDGTIYASDDFAANLDRVLPDGTVQRGWLKLIGNGLALSADEKTLYVNQSLPSRIMAVDLTTSPPTVRVHATPPASSALAFLDGLTMGPDGALYAATDLAGEVWRITADSRICVLAKGMPLASAVAAGRAGQGFSPTSLYVTSFSGKLYELANVLH